MFYLPFKKLSTWDRTPDSLLNQMLSEINKMQFQKSHQFTGGQLDMSDQKTSVLCIGHLPLYFTITVWIYKEAFLLIDNDPILKKYIITNRFCMLQK